MGLDCGGKCVYFLFFMAENLDIQSNLSKSFYYQFTFVSKWFLCSEYLQ